MDDDRGHRATIVLPTRNELRSLLLLIAALGELLEALEIDGVRRVDVLVVDESDADVRVEVESRARAAGVSLTFLRPDPGRRLGVAKSTLLGIRATAGRFVLVMDADLQHPPEVALSLLAFAVDRRADIAIGTRYGAGGSADGLSSAWRRLVSRTSTAVGRRLVGAVSDPMSGLFVLDLDRVHLPETGPDGFKLLMEILAGNGHARVVELPYTFQPRAFGRSNASAVDGVSFLLQLGRLTLTRLTGFGVIGRRGRPGSRESPP
jgi:dolichol-phosphate mannosyltransferase